MAADLLTLLLSFQPDTFGQEKMREYDAAARSFVTQVANVPVAQWSKGADTEQDVLVVRRQF